MSRSGLSRLLGALAACLLGFSSAGVAVAHAMVHAHWTVDHSGATPFAVPTVEDGDHGHDHEHTVVAKAPAPRDGLRLDVALPVILTTVALPLPPRADARVPSRPTPLLPRPGPERGPPSGPRAPPTA